MDDAGLPLTDTELGLIVITLIAFCYGPFFADVRRARDLGLTPPNLADWNRQGGPLAWIYRSLGWEPPWWLTWRAPEDTPAWARLEGLGTSPVTSATPSDAAPTPTPTPTPAPAPAPAPAPDATTTAPLPKSSAQASPTTVADASPTKGAVTTVADPQASGTVTDTRVAPAPPGGDLPAWVRTTLAAALGERYGDWSLLGAGGMGVVVRGTDRKLGRDVAVKLPPPQLAAHPQFRERFLREAQAQARLTHAAIGRVLDVPDVPPGEIPVMVLEFLAGEDLAARLERLGPEPVDVVRGRIVEAAAGLAHAHAKGVLHRDVKPSNLMLVEDQVRLLDFGLAALEGSDKLTTTGMVMGSLPYMPPEQLAGEPVGEAADQFSLAVTGFELLTGRLPFGPEDRARSAPADASALRPEIPASLAAALTRGMAAAPADRFSDLEVFGEGLREA